MRRTLTDVRRTRSRRCVSLTTSIMTPMAMSIPPTVASRVTSAPGPVNAREPAEAVVSLRAAVAAPVELGEVEPADVVMDD